MTEALVQIIPTWRSARLATQVYRCVSQEMMGVAWCCELAMVDSGDGTWIHGRCMGPTIEASWCVLYDNLA